MALQNVQQCALVHDQCRRIDNDPWVGQNLAYVFNYGASYDDRTAIEKSIAMWYNENMNTTQSDINQLPDDMYVAFQISDRRESIELNAIEFTATILAISRK